MLWLKDGVRPLRDCHWQSVLATIPGWVVAVIVYTAFSLGGFCFVAGHKLPALMMGVIPLALGGMTLGCLVCGWLWQSLAEPGKAFPTRSAGLCSCFVEGLQLLVFYGVLFSFMASLALLAWPFAVIVGAALLVAHPLMLAPVVASQHERSIVGLMEGCFIAGRWATHHYGYVWAETTLYVLGFGLCYLLLGAVLSATGLGVFMLPGLVGLFAMGYMTVLEKLQLTWSDVPIKGEARKLSLDSSYLSSFNPEEARRSAVPESRFSRRSPYQ